MWELYTLALCRSVLCRSVLCRSVLCRLAPCRSMYGAANTQNHSPKRKPIRKKEKQLMTSCVA